MPYRCLVLYQRTTAGSTISKFDLNLANLGDRALTVGEAYEFFRLESLHAYSVVDTVVPAGTGITSGGSIFHALAFVNSPAGSMTTPTTIALLSQADKFAAAGPCGEPHIRVSRSDLLGEPLVWYNTYNTGSIPANQLSAGTILNQLAVQTLGTVVGVNQTIFIEGIIAFHSPIDTADSLLVRVPRNKLDDAGVSKAVDRLRLTLAE